MKKILTIFLVLTLVCSFASCKKKPDSSAASSQTNGDLHKNKQSESVVSSSKKEQDTTHSHVYSSSVISPTCLEQGYTKYTCACGDTYNDNYVPAKGHTEVIDKAVAATLSSTGLTEGKHCSVCGTILVAQKKVPKLTTVTHATKGNSSFTLMNDLNEEYTCGPLSAGPNKCKMEKFVCSISTLGNGQINLYINFNMRKTAQGNTTSKDIKVIVNLYRDGKLVDGGIMLESNAEVGSSYAKSMTKYFLPEGNYTMKIASFNQ